MKKAYFLLSVNTNLSYFTYYLIPANCYLLSVYVTCICNCNPL